MWHGAKLAWNHACRLHDLWQSAVEHVTQQLRYTPG
jgi:hypothetical protein